MQEDDLTFIPDSHFILGTVALSVCEDVAWKIKFSCKFHPNEKQAFLLFRMEATLYTSFLWGGIQRSFQQTVLWSSILVGITHEKGHTHTHTHLALSHELDDKLLTCCKLH